MKGRTKLKKISLLGATGSIGWQTYDILKSHPEEFKLVAFSAGKNIEKTREIIKNYNRSWFLCKRKKMQCIKKRVSSYKFYIRRTRFSRSCNSSGYERFIECSFRKCWIAIDISCHSYGENDCNRE